MIYQLDIAEVAKRDRDDAYEFYKENYSKQFADKWYLGIAAAIRSLKENPERKGLVHENASLSVECRQYIYHTSKQYRHRIVFTIAEETVYVLRIRHSSQKDLQQSDLPQRNG